MPSNDQPVNFFSGSPLNRLAWLRTSPHFLSAMVENEATRWIVFQDGQPLIASRPGTKDRSLALLPTTDIRALLGPEPYFSQTQKEGESADSSEHLLEAARLHGPGVVFLGLHETNAEDAGALPSSDFNAKQDALAVVSKIKGTAYFTVDVTRLQEQDIQQVLQSSDAAKNGTEFTFVDGRTAMGYMDYFIGGIYASARALVDWNARNKFCAACGAPVYSLWAGWKLGCTSLLPWSDNTNRPPCPTAKGLHNQAHPRTDPVVIMAVVNEENDKVLLGRNRKWPGKFYSALAGFVEPGEAFEDAVKRELWEEAGLKVWGIQYHSTQPWPFPSNLMVGFYAIADPSLPTRTDLDNELEDARWYTREEVLAVLAHPHGTKMGNRDPQKPDPQSTAGNLAGDAVAKNGPGSTPATLPDEPLFRLPPITAIAGVLVSDWAHRRVVITGTDVSRSMKGNL